MPHKYVHRIQVKYLGALDVVTGEFVHIKLQRFLFVAMLCMVACLIASKAPPAWCQHALTRHALAQMPAHLRRRLAGQSGGLRGLKQGRMHWQGSAHPPTRNGTTPALLVPPRGAPPMRQSCLNTTPSTSSASANSQMSTAVMNAPYQKSVNLSSLI